MPSPYLVAADAQDRSEDDIRELAKEMNKAKAAWESHFLLNTSGKNEDEMADIAISSERALQEFLAASDAFRRSVK